MDDATPAPLLAAEPITDFADEPRAVPWREVLAVLVLVTLSDLAIYRGAGFFGYGCLFFLAPGCLVIGSEVACGRRRGWLFGALLIGLAARLAWCRSWLAVGCGFFCLVALAMCLSGRTPHVLSLMGYTGQTLAAGARGLNQYGEVARRNLRPWQTSAWIAVVMPAAAIAVFGTIFVLANPDLVSWFSKEFQLFLNRVNEWFVHFSMLEIPFWIAAAWIAVGLLRPLDAMTAAIRRPTANEPPPESSALYAAFRNTLCAVIVLFLVYLPFEFHTLWFRAFPKGFYYSGYAHEGAAWLTLALAVATLMLSLIFRKSMLHDPRLPALKRLAWLWSALNILLAVAVYNRLLIYVGFNGMTRMRMVGFFGTSAVVIGFLLAVFKISRHRDFTWLLRADLWALAATIIAFALTPVDLVVMRYNTHRILAGDSAPSVQISVHPIDAEGVRELLPLINCQDELVRDGVRALLARRWLSLESTPANRPIAINPWQDFTRVQFSERRLVEDLAAARATWEPFYTDGARQSVAWERFKLYAYQWY